MEIRTSYCVSSVFFLEYLLGHRRKFSIIIIIKKGKKLKRWATLNFGQKWKSLGQSKTMLIRFIIDTNSNWFVSSSLNFVLDRSHKRRNSWKILKQFFLRWEYSFSIIYAQNQNECVWKTKIHVCTNTHTHHIIHTHTHKRAFSPSRFNSEIKVRNFSLWRKNMKH